MLAKFKANWKTSLIATLAIPELLRQIANFMDSDPLTVCQPTLVLVAFATAFGLFEAADAKKPDEAVKAKGKK